MQREAKRIAGIAKILREHLPNHSIDARIELTTALMEEEKKETPELKKGQLVQHLDGYGVFELGTNRPIGTYKSVKLSDLRIENGATPHGYDVDTKQWSTNYFVFVKPKEKD